MVAVLQVITASAMPSNHLVNLSKVSIAASELKTVKTSSIQLFLTDLKVRHS